MAEKVDPQPDSIRRAPIAAASDTLEMEKINPRDLSALAATVNDASSRAAALWVSFLTFAAYLTITVGSVSHVMLFRETPIKLPVLNVDLPLVAFFTIVPFFFLFFHFYLFMQLVIMARKIATYDQVLQEKVLSAEDRRLLRRRLDTFLIAQLLCGAEDERKGITGRLLGWIAWVTLVGAPIALLLQFQLSFLPYHSDFTWVHRIVILVDVGLIWIFWFPIRHGEGVIRLPAVRSHPLALAASSLVVATSTFVIAYMGEGVGQVWKISVPWLCPEGPVPVADCMLRGTVNFVQGKSRYFFSNVLVLPNYKWDEPDEKQRHLLSLRGRDLTGAVLAGMDLRGADFTGAKLNDARLDGANLSGAKFTCDDTGRHRNADLPSRWPDDGCAWLEGASLKYAILDASLFVNARMKGAVLIGANLHGARLTIAHLEAAALDQANFLASDLSSADLQGASLVQAQFVGVRLDNARLQGAWLKGALFEVSSLNNVQVKGTVGTPSLDFSQFELREDEPPKRDIVVFQSMRKEILARIYREESQKFSGQFRDTIDTFDPVSDTSPGETDWAKARRDFEIGWESALSVPVDNSPTVSGQDSPTVSGQDDPSERRASFLAKYFRSIACGSARAPYAARGLIQNEMLVSMGTGIYLENFAKALKDTKNCEGASGLGSADYEALNSFVAAARHVKVGQKAEIPNRPSGGPGSSLAGNAVVPTGDAVPR